MKIKELNKAPLIGTRVWNLKKTKQGVVKNVDFDGRALIKWDEKDGEERCNNTCAEWQTLDYEIILQPQPSTEKKSWDPSHYFVFDVESLGLHGPAFAIGFVVIEASTGKEIKSDMWCLDPDKLPSTLLAREWVTKNCQWIKRYSDKTFIANKMYFYDHFWSYWDFWKEQGAVMAADCPWPVEANFLNAAITHSKIDREWSGPYPLIDVASIRLAAGFDPLASESRLKDELPVHNPLTDARQSARLLFEALQKVRQA